MAVSHDRVRSGREEQTGTIGPEIRLKDDCVKIVTRQITRLFTRQIMREVTGNAAVGTARAILSKLWDAATSCWTGRVREVAHAPCASIAFFGIQAPARPVVR